LIAQVHYGSPSEASESTGRRWRAVAAVLAASAVFASACTSGNPVTGSDPGPSTADTTQPSAFATTTVPPIDPAAAGTWTLDTDDPTAAWLDPPEHMTITVTISSITNDLINSSVSVTLGCSEHGGGAISTNAGISVPTITIAGVDCPFDVARTEEKASSFVFSAHQPVQVNGDTLTIGESPDQLVLHRSADTSDNTAAVDPAIYGTWDVPWDYPGLLRFDLPADTTLSVTVSEAPADSVQPWKLEITLGCQVWDADTLTAHPLSEPLPDQMIADCGPLATSEQNVAFTVLKGNYPLSIDGGHLSSAHHRTGSTCTQQADHYQPPTRSQSGVPADDGREPLVSTSARSGDTPLRGLWRNSCPTR